MPLLYSTLEALRRRLDRVLQGEEPHAEPIAVLANLGASEDGEGLTRDRLVLSLVGLQHDTTLSAANATTWSNDVATPPAPMRLNPTVLITANFASANYGAGLAVLSRVIGFLHANPVFTPATLPGLEASVDRLALDFLNLDPGQMNSLFGASGSRYMPCAAYRLRSLPFAREMLDVPLVRDPELNVKPVQAPSSGSRIPSQ